MSRATNIYFEQSPNPDSLKFVANYLIVPDGTSFDFPDAPSTEKAPLARELFDYSYVRRVFYMNNFITITKDPETEWVDVREELKQHIKNYLEAEKPILLEKESSDDKKEESELDMKIRLLLEEYVKPAVEQDGGAIEYHSFNNGVVKLLLQGACSGCPSSMLTLKAGIENLLTSMIPEVKSVEAEGV